MAVLCRQHFRINYFRVKTRILRNLSCIKGGCPRLILFVLMSSLFSCRRALVGRSTGPVRRSVCCHPKLVAIAFGNECLRVCSMDPFCFCCRNLWVVFLALCLSLFRPPVVVQAPARERGGVACSSLSSLKRRPGREEAWPTRRCPRRSRRCVSAQQLPFAGGP